MESFFLCLDVGGTEIKAACVSRVGKLLCPVARFPSKASGTREEILTHLAKICRQVCPDGRKTAGVRFAFPGPFDYQRGICQMQGLSKYDHIYGVNLREAMASLLGLPEETILFCNDVAAFAMGEMAYGRAAGAERTMCVCIGTGCGSAFGVKGVLASEETPGVPPHGYIYPLPFLDSCIDDYLSRRGLMALSQRRLGSAEDGASLAKRCAAGDSAACECFMAFGMWVRDALIPIAKAFHPDVLCMGGAITQSEALFLPPLRQACQDCGIQLAITEDTSLRTIQGLSALQ